MRISERKCAYLDRVEAASDTAVLHLNMGRRMRVLALMLASAALVALELAANLQSEPPIVLDIVTTARSEQPLVTIQAGVHHLQFVSQHGE